MPALTFTHCAGPKRVNQAPNRIRLLTPLFAAGVTTSLLTKRNLDHKVLLSSIIDFAIMQVRRAVGDAAIAKEGAPRL